MGFPDAFVTLNKANSSEHLIDSTIDQVAASLFSVLLTFGGQPPLIYSAKGTAAQSLGEKLDMRIRNYLGNAKTPYLGGTDGNEVTVEDSLQRPLLLLLDRNFDLSSLLRHTSTYNALVHDILGIKLNRVTLRKEDGAKVYDIDGKDTFWRTNAPLPFPTVAENVDLALNNYRADMQRVTRNNANLQNMDDLNAASSTLTAEELRTAITVLPELTERKRIIDCHLQVSTSLLEQIKTRDLGNLFHVEQQCLASDAKSKILEIIRGKEATAMDKLRLFLVYFFAVEDMARTDLALFESALNEAGADLRALEHCKRVKSFVKMSLASSQGASSAMTLSTAGSSAGLASFGSRLTSGVLGNVLSSVKNLLPESADTPLTKLIDSALESALGASSLRATLTGSSTPKEDNFAVYDPKVKERIIRPVAQRTAFNHLIVFIVGGSNYTEYNHAVEFVGKKQPQLAVTFGSTELLTGEEFINQLASL